MSLILEALRKSEAERQLGRPPGLLSPAPSVASNRAIRWWLAPAVLLLLAVGLVSWWLGRQGAAPDTAAPSTASSATPDSASAEIEPVSGSPPTAPPAARPTASAATRPADPVSPAVESRTMPDPKPVVPTPVPEPSSSTSPVPTGMAASPQVPAPTAGDSNAAEPLIPLARIDHMPAADRARLPALKLSVHLYAEQSDRRFAIIDGRRVTDSDSLANDLTVKAIVPEGVLLVFEGRTWLLPRP